MTYIRRIYDYMNARPLARMHMPVCGLHIMLTSSKAGAWLCAPGIPFLLVQARSVLICPALCISIC